MKNYFQFACELEPIDRFPGCMSKDDLLENLLRQDTQAGFLVKTKTPASSGGSGKLKAISPKGTTLC